MFPAIPSLSDRDSYSPFIDNAVWRIANQVCPVRMLEPYVTPAYGGRFDVGMPSRLEAITDRLNNIVEAFLKTEATHLWIVDADVEPPPFALDTLMRLDVDVASGVYSFHNDPEILMFGRMPPGEKYGMVPRGFIGFSGDGVIGDKFRVGGGNGCMLVKRRVVLPYSDHYPPLRFACTRDNGSDVNFWYQAQEAGFKCRVHGGVKCGHLSHDEKRNVPLEYYYPEKEKND